jgi:L-ascorbate metabolism protein UlaG (beta-lactamase superfamily)
VLPARLLPRMNKGGTIPPADPADAVRAVTQLIKPRVVIPMHYGANPLAKGTAKAFVDAMGPGPIKVIVAVPGQPLEF